MRCFKFKLGARRPKPSDSFTLVELLTVMGIIAILMALVLGAGNGVIVKAMRNRASTEVQAMSTALEGYKTDNGIYPPSDGVLLTNTYITYDGTMPNYQTNATLVYIALSGQSNALYAPAAGTKVYMAFKANQTATSNNYTYVADPWHYSYGYSTGTGTTSPPYTGNGFFDLWSTGGTTAAKPNTNAWLSNWTQ